MFWKKIDNKITLRLAEKNLLIPSLFLLCMVIEIPFCCLLCKCAKQEEQTKQVEKVKPGEKNNALKVIPVDTIVRKVR